MSATLTSGTLRAVRHATRLPGTLWYLALDAGQRRDHSALAVLQLHWTHIGQCGVTYEHLFQPNLQVCFLKRFPIGLSYEKLYGLIREQLLQLDPNLPAKSKRLVIDAGGPGPPLVDRGTSAI
jgi:hypothetical protein